MAYSKIDRFSIFSTPSGTSHVTKEDAHHLVIAPVDSLDGKLQKMATVKKDENFDVASDVVQKLRNQIIDIVDSKLSASVSPKQ